VPELASWLLVRGTGHRPLDQRIDGDRLRAHSSTRRPAIQLGDLAVCYAAVWQSLFAVVQAVRRCTRTRGGGRLVNGDAIDLKYPSKYL
jgi:hypothetical protein